MSELNSPPIWKKYYENAKVDPEAKTRIVDAEKQSRQALFSETQNFDDIKAAVKAVGEVQNGSKVYAAGELEAIFEGVKDGSKSLTDIPETAGMRDAAKNALEMIAKQEYEDNLENLFREFKALFDAKDFNAFFKSFTVGDKTVSAEEKLKKLQAEYDKIGVIFKPENFKNPSDGQTSAEILEIAAQAKAMLEAYKGEADNVLGKKAEDESKAKIKELTTVSINTALGAKKKIAVKAEYSPGSVGPGWVIVGIKGDVVEVEDTAGGRKTFKLAELKTWNTFAHTDKPVNNPKSDPAEKAKLDTKNVTVGKMDKTLKDERTEGKKQADEKRKSFEEKRVKKAEETEKKKSTPEEMVVEKLLRELDDARRNFAEVEYKERTNMERIRKFFRTNDQERAEIQRKLHDGPDAETRLELEKKLKNSENVQAYQKVYQDALKAFMEHEISKLEKSGLEKEELKNQIKELYSFFNLDETIRYYDVRTAIKLESLKGSEAKNGNEKGPWKEKWDKMRLKMNKATEWYSKKVPLKYKLALAAVTFIPGAVLAFGGVVPAAGLVAGAAAISLVRRAWGAMMVASSGGMFADKMVQGWDKKVDKKERDADFRNIKEAGKIDYDKLRGILDGKIGDIDNKLNKRNLSSSASKYLAFGAAIFSSATLMHSLLDFQGTMEASTAGISNAFKSIKGFGGHVEDIKVPGAGAHSAAEAAAAHTGELTAKELPMKEGSSIEAALRDHYRAEKMGNEAHLEFRDYMNGKIAAMKEALKHDPTDVKTTAKLKEYQEMLKTGRVNIHAGDKLFVDAKGKLTDIQVDAKHGGDIKMLHNVHHAQHVQSVEHSTAAAEAAVNPDVTTEMGMTAADNTNTAAEFAGNLVDNHSGPTLNENFVQYAPEHSDVPDFSDPLVQEDAPVEVKSNIIDLAIRNGIDRSFYQSHGHGHFRPFLERHGRLFEQHNHQGALRAIRETMMRNGDAWRGHRADNVFDLMENNNRVFSREGRKMMAELIKSGDLKPNGENISLEECTRGIVKKMAA